MHDNQGPNPFPLQVELADDTWGPRRRQLRDHTLPTLLERYEDHGVLDAFRRLAPGAPASERRGLWFTDSDLYKWMEAAAWAGRLDLLDGVIDVVLHAARADGYVHTFYDAGPGSQGRYGDLANSHEWYCAGHLTEAAIAHHAVTGETTLLDVASRWADHLAATFGPGRDERVDGHPEAELALARLARTTGQARHLDQARWIIERQLDLVGRSIDDVELAGHAVRALYLASGITEVALATGEARWRDAAVRLFDSLVDEHSYPTGGVGGRWLDESIGKPFELPDAMAYAESCAAVASVQFARRIWELTGELRALEQLELTLFNAVACGVGAGGDTWFYSQPHAVASVGSESNPWALPYDYGPNMLLSWFPTHRHEWFDVGCCPPNLARLFATVDHLVADLDDGGNLLVHLPVAARVRGGGWDVELTGGVPAADAGAVDAVPLGVAIHAAPEGADVLVRHPGWSGGAGHVRVADGGALALEVRDEWWSTDRRVEGAAGTAFARRGPFVLCVEGVDLPELDLADLVVDPTAPPGRGFWRFTDRPGGLHHPHLPARLEPVDTVPLTPYSSWANRGLTTMRLRFPVVDASAH